MAGDLSALARRFDPVRTAELQWRDLFGDVVWRKILRALGLILGRYWIENALPLRFKPGGVAGYAGGKDGLPFWEAKRKASTVRGTSWAGSMAVNRPADTSPHWIDEASKARARVSVGRRGFRARVSVPTGHVIRPDVGRAFKTISPAERFALDALAEQTLASLIDEVQASRSVYRRGKRKGQRRLAKISKATMASAAEPPIRHLAALKAISVSNQAKADQASRAGREAWKRRAGGYLARTTAAERTFYARRAAAARWAKRAA